MGIRAHQQYSKRKSLPSTHPTTNPYDYTRTYSTKNRKQDTTKRNKQTHTIPSKTSIGANTGSLMTPLPLPPLSPPPPPPLPPSLPAAVAALLTKLTLQVKHRPSPVRESRTCTALDRVGWRTYVTRTARMRIFAGFGWWGMLVKGRTG